MAPNPPRVAVTARQAASNAAYVARVLAVIREGPSTIGAAKKRTGMGSTQLLDVLSHLLAAGAVTRANAPTRGRPTHVYTLVSEPVDAASVSVRRYTHAHTGRAKADDEAHEFEGTSGVFTFGMERSLTETDCPTLGRVVLAACIDGYVSDTSVGMRRPCGKCSACVRGSGPCKNPRSGPCDSCAIGRARRAAWAGADFEDELEADDSDSLDLR